MFSSLDCLIDVEYHESGGKKFIRLASFLQVCIGNMMFDAPRSLGRAHGAKPHTFCAQVLSSHFCFFCVGRLLRKHNSALSADLVEFEVGRSLEWLNESGPMYERHRHAAVLVLKELGMCNSWCVHFVI